MTTFNVITAAQTTPNSIRVTFSAPVYASNPLGANDGLNARNYGLVGPEANGVTNITLVYGDATSLDVVTTYPLVVGTWTVTVNNVVATDGTGLTTPNYHTFNVTGTTFPATISDGSENDTPAGVIRKNLSSVFQGKVWDGLIAALAVGDQIVWDNDKAAQAQMFLSTASGEYLKQRAADVGIQKPANLGMSDDLFRKYVIKTTNSKMVKSALLDILEVFYGQSAVTAYADTTLTEPFVLADGLTLDLLLEEETPVHIIFSTEDFADIEAATGLEIAAVITRSIATVGSQGSATTITSPVTNETQVRVYSGSRGLGSSVRVTGGTAQPFLGFPTPINVYTGSIVPGNDYNWVVTRTPNNQSLFTLNINTDTQPVLVDFFQLLVGDYVVINEQYAGVSTGVFPLSDVGVSFDGATQTVWFETELYAGFTGMALQTANQAYTFSRPTKLTTQQNPKSSVILSQNGQAGFDVVIPATTQTVNRTPQTAAYVTQTTPVEALSLERIGHEVTVTTTTPHGLSAGDQVLVEDITPNGGDDYGLTPPDAPTANLVTVGGGGMLSVGAYAYAMTFVTGFGESDPSSLSASVTVVDPDTTDISLTNLSTSSDSRVVGRNLYRTKADGTFLYLVTPLDNETVVYTDNTPDASLSEPMPGLVTPGNLDEGITDSSPVTVVSSVAAQPSSGSYDHTLTVLSDGTVLKVGGTVDSPTNTTEIFTITETTPGPKGQRIFQYGWTTAAYVPNPVAGHAAVLMSSTGNEGNVAVVGGFYDNNFDESANVYIYTPGPDGGSWEAVALFMGVWKPTAHEASDGTIVAVGGLVEEEEATNYIQIYDPSDNSVNQAYMAYARSDHASVVLPNGKILITGGSDGPRVNLDLSYADNIWYQCEIYDPETQVCTPTGSMFWARSGHQLVLLEDGRVLAVGGWGFSSCDSQSTVVGDRKEIDQIEVYDYVTGRWSCAGKLQIPRRWPNVNLLSDKVLVSFGKDVDGNPVQPEVLEYIDLNTLECSAVPVEYVPPNENVQGVVELPSSVVLGDDTVFFNGGPDYDGNKTLSLLYVRGSDVKSSGGIQGIFKVTSTTVNSFTFETEDPGYVFDTEGIVVTPMTATVSRLGANVYDTTKPTVTATNSTLTVGLTKGKSYSTLVVDDATVFPNTPGWLVVGFGTAWEASPVLYYGVQSETELILDYSFKFPATVPVGANVTLLSGKGAWDFNTDYPNSFWATASSAGQLAAVAALQKSIAAGFPVRITVVYPGDFGLAKDSDKYIWGN
jgi:hypothetical protein